MISSTLLSILLLLGKKMFRQRHFHNFNRKFFIVVPILGQNSLILQDSPLEIVGNVRLERIQSIRVVILLIVDVHLNIVKNSAQNVVDMIKERNWNLWLLLRSPFPHLLLLHLCAPFLLLW